MPRNITITLADGSQHTYANAPDNVTPGQVTARAMKEFGQSVTKLDGGRPAAPAPAAPAAPPSLRNGFGLGPPPAKGTPQRQAYDTEYNKRFNAAWLRNNPQEAQRRAQATRIQTGAANNSARNVQNSGNFLTSLKAGVTRGLFGVPERLAAAGEAYLPSWMTGNTSNASYGQILDTIRANTDADLGKSTPGNIIGQIAGGVGGGRLAAGAVGAVGSRLAASGAPVAARVGNFLQNMLTLNKGQKAANAAKIITAGGAQGGVQALGEGSDVTTGVLGGAAGAAVVGGGFKAAQVLTRPFRDFLRLSSAGQILSRLTGATQAQLEQRAAAYRAATGAEPTVFELLPLADRNKVLKQAVVGRDNVVEATSGAIRRRAQNLGPEMSARARAILTPSRNFVESGLRRDLTQARGGTLLPDDEGLIARAADNPTDLNEFRGAEADAIMAPHNATPVGANLSDLLPSVPGPNGTRVSVDPEVDRLISSAAGVINSRAAGAGINVNDVTGIMTKLRGYVSRGGPEGDVAERAIAHLQDTLDNVAPDAGAAARRMTDQYAARSRMMEGVEAGGQTRMRGDVDVGTSNKAARKVRNAYDTPEGANGRVLGQSARILGDLAGSPEEALRSTVRMSRNSIGRPLAQNIGAPEAEALTAAARAQDDSAQALAAASQKAGGSDGQTADAETLATALAGLHPSGFITTKAGAMRKLIDMTYIPEGRARAMVEMLFSQDPGLQGRALRAIGNEPNGAAFIKRLAGVVGSLSGQAANAPETAEELQGDPALEPAPVDDMPPAGDDEAAEPAPDNEGAEATPAPGDDPNVPYGRAVVSSLFPEAEITEDVRDPNSKLGRENPGSEHIKTQNAVDVRPIPGMTFAQFIGKINDAGYSVVEAIDEVNHPSKWATGPHWHVVVA